MRYDWSASPEQYLENTCDRQVEVAACHDGSEEGGTRGSTCGNGEGTYYTNSFRLDAGERKFNSYLFPGDARVQTAACFSVPGQNAFSRATLDETPSYACPGGSAPPTCEEFVEGLSSVTIADRLATGEAQTDLAVEAVEFAVGLVRGLGTFFDLVRPSGLGTTEDAFNGAYAEAYNRARVLESDLERLESGAVRDPEAFVRRVAYSEGQLRRALRNLEIAAEGVFVESTEACHRTATVQFLASFRNNAEAVVETIRLRVRDGALPGGTPNERD